MHIVVIKLNMGLKTWAYFHSICPAFAFDLGHIAAAHLADTDTTRPHSLWVSPDWATKRHQIHICSVALSEPAPICYSSVSVCLHTHVCFFTAQRRWISPAVGIADGFFLLSSASPCLLVFRGTVSPLLKQMRVVSYSNVRGILRLA